jgi:hypothetical protein
MLRIFGMSVLVAAIGLVTGYLYGGLTGLAVTAILVVLEVSISFDNAVVNATVLGRMSPAWQRLFLTVGVAIAVFGMRLIFPLLVVGISASLGPVEALRLALEKGDPATPGSYGYLLHEAHPAIAAFGGIFLLMLFLNFVLAEREVVWLKPVERALARVGRVEGMAILIAGGALLLAAAVLAPADRVGTVLGSGLAGLLTYLAVDGLGSYFESRMERLPGAGPSGLAQVAGRAAFFLFLYLEVIDASFSFDGVIGAFAITSDPVVIALGLGVGAMFIRSITVYLVRRRTLEQYVYLEHGAMWAIGALAAVLLITIAHEVPEIVTGVLGLGFIVAALISSVAARRERPAVSAEPAESISA